jgi:hypothetical protein
MEGARTICQEGHGTAVPFLKAPLTQPPLRSEGGVPPGLPTRKKAFA